MAFTAQLAAQRDFQPEIVPPFTATDFYDSQTVVVAAGDTIAELHMNVGTTAPNVSLIFVHEPTSASDYQSYFSCDVFFEVGGPI